MIGRTHEGVQGLKLVCVHQLVVDGPQVSHIVCLVCLLHTMAATEVDEGSSAHKIGGCFVARIPCQK